MVQVKAFAEAHSLSQEDALNSA